MRKRSMIKSESLLINRLVSNNYRDPKEKDLLIKLLNNFNKWEQNRGSAKKDLKVKNLLKKL